MNIRVKVISLLALLFAALIGIDVGIQRQILMPSFAELERDDAKVSMKRIKYALDLSLDTIALTAADSGNWKTPTATCSRPTRSSCARTSRRPH